MNPAFAVLISQHPVSHDAVLPEFTLPDDGQEHSKSLDTLLREATRRFDALCKNVFRVEQIFSDGVDKQYAGINIVEQHRTTLYQAFTFIDKRFNDRRIHCRRLLQVVTQNHASILHSNMVQSNMVQSNMVQPNIQSNMKSNMKSNMQSLQSNLRGLHPISKWLHFALALYQYRDGVPYLQLAFQRSEIEGTRAVVELIVELANKPNSKVDQQLSHLNLSAEGLTFMRALICDARNDSGSATNSSRHTFTTFSLGMNQSGKMFGARCLEKGHRVLGVASTGFEIIDSETEAYKICTATYTNRDIRSHRLISLTTTMVLKDGAAASKQQDTTMHERQLCRFVVKPGKHLSVSFLILNKFHDSRLHGMWVVETHQDSSLLINVSLKEEVDEYYEEEGQEDSAIDSSTEAQTRCIIS